MKKLLILIVLLMATKWCFAADPKYVSSLDASSVAPVAEDLMIIAPDGQDNAKKITFDTMMTNYPSNTDLVSSLSSYVTTSAMVTSLDNQTHTGTTISGLGAADFTSQNISQWVNDSGFLTAESDPVYLAAPAASIDATSLETISSAVTSESDPVFIASDAYVIDATSLDYISDGETAFGWGNHSDEGYLTGNQFITISGDIIGGGTTSVVTTFGMINENDLTLNDATTLDASTTKHGFLKKLSNVSTEFLNGQGNWATPAGGAGGTSVSPTITFSGNDSTFAGAITATHGTFTTSVTTPAISSTTNSIAFGNNTIAAGTATFVNITATGLTASRLVSTGTTKGLASTITSANAASTVSDETGSGLWVFNISPTLASPTINGPTISGTTTVSTFTSNSGSILFSKPIASGTATLGSIFDLGVKSATVLATDANGQVTSGTTDGSGTCAAGAVCTGGHTHPTTEVSGVNAGTDLTGDLEEETHASEHLENAADEITVEALGTACAENKIFKANSSGGVECADDSTGGSPTFDAIASGTNTTATMILGAGSTFNTVAGDLTYLAPYQKGFGMSNTAGLTDFDKQVTVIYGGSVVFSSIYCVTAGGTATIDFTVGGTAVNGSAITCTTAGVTDSSLGGDVNGATSEILSIDGSGYSGTVTDFMAIINGTQTVTF